MDQPRRVGNKMIWISWKLFDAESCLLSFRFCIYIRDSLTGVYFASITLSVYISGSQIRLQSLGKQIPGPHLQFLIQ